MSMDKVLRIYNDEDDNDLTVSFERADDRDNYTVKVVYYHHVDKYSLDLSAEEMEAIVDYFNEVLA